MGFKRARVRMIPRRAIGRLIQKIHLQERTSVKYPPIKGPSTKEIEPMLTMIPVALPLDSLGKERATRDVCAGNIIAAPAPCNALAPIRYSTFVLIPQRSEKKAKKMIPVK